MEGYSFIERGPRRGGSGKNNGYRCYFSSHHDGINDGFDDKIII